MTPCPLPSVFPTGLSRKGNEGDSDSHLLPGELLISLSPGLFFPSFLSGNEAGLEPLTTISTKTPWTHHSLIDEFTSHWYVPAIMEGAGHRVANQTDVCFLFSQVTAV